MISGQWAGPRPLTFRFQKQHSTGPWTNSFSEEGDSLPCSHSPQTHSPRLKSTLTLAFGFSHEGKGRDSLKPLDKLIALTYICQKNLGYVKLTKTHNVLRQHTFVPCSFFMTFIGQLGNLFHIIFILGVG